MIYNNKGVKQRKGTHEDLEGPSIETIGTSSFKSNEYRFHAFLESWSSRKNMSCPSVGGRYGEVWWDGVCVCDSCARGIVVGSFGTLA